MDDKINRSLIEANTKLVDENKVLKEDKMMLQRRIDRAIEYINKEFVFSDGTLGEADIKLLDILKGESVDEHRFIFV